MLKAKERADFAISRARAAISHLHSVADTPELRDPCGEAQLRPDVHYLKVGINRALDAVIRAVAEMGGLNAPSPATGQSASHSLRDFAHVPGELASRSSRRH